MKIKTTKGDSLVLEKMLNACGDILETKEHNDHKEIACELKDDIATVILMWIAEENRRETNRAKIINNLIANQ